MTSDWRKSFKFFYNPSINFEIIHIKNCFMDFTRSMTSLFLFRDELNRKRKMFEILEPQIVHLYTYFLKGKKIITVKSVGENEMCTCRDLSIHSYIPTNHCIALHCRPASKDRKCFLLQTMEWGGVKVNVMFTNIPFKKWLIFSQTDVTLDLLFKRVRCEIVRVMGTPGQTDCQRQNIKTDFKISNWKSSNLYELMMTPGKI